MGVITVGIMVLLFKPKWLDNINPLKPSQLTAKTVNSSQCKTATGIIVPKEEQLAVQVNIENNREERKAKRRQEMNASTGGWMKHMNARAERRAAREAKRIMMAKRQACIAAFTEEDA